MSIVSARQPPGLERRLRLAGRVLVLLLMTILGPSRLANAADREPVEFADQTALALGAEPVPATVVNNTVRTWQLSVFAELIGEDTSTPIPVRLSDVPQSIAPSGLAVFTVGPAPSDVAKGTGFLVATATAGDDTVVTRRPLVLASSTPKPLVKKWFGSSQEALPPLPLDGGTCGTVTSGEVYVVSGSDIAPLEYECTATESIPELTFTADQVRQVGQYTGTLNLGGTDVEISFLKTVHWLPPLLVILIGFLAAAAQHAWVNSYRPVRKAANRLISIGGAAERNQREFERRAGAEPYRVYYFLKGVFREIARLQRRLGALRPALVRRWFLGFWPWGQAENDDEYKAILEEMATLEARVNDWPTLADALGGLAGRLSQAEKDGSARFAQKLVERARTILTPGGGQPTQVELEWKDASSLLVETPKTSDSLGLLSRVVELDKALAELRPEVGRMPPSDQEVFEEADRRYRRARAELATTRDAAAVERAKVDQLLRATRDRILQLPKPAVVIEAQAVSGAPVGELTVGFVSLFRAITQVGARVAGNVRVADGVWLLVALAVAAWTGLAALYVDKPWGRLVDYIALFVWAFGTTAVLTPVLSGLERVAAGPLRLK